MAAARGGTLSWRGHVLQYKKKHDCGGCGRKRVVEGMREGREEEGGGGRRREVVGGR